MGNKRLPPGFRFHPTDVELIRYYLKRKVLGKKLHFEAIAELDIYKYTPWDLPDRSLMKTGDLKWYFFCPRAKKYSSGSRMNRATETGYWKTTGKDRPVLCKNEVVGMIKTLVFHTGKAPKGDRTDWVMYEYRLEEKDFLDKGVAQNSYVLCSIFKKDGPGPKNGASYGAPFNEEEWDDDVEVEEMNCIETVSSATQPIHQNQPTVSCLLSPEALPSTSNSVSVVADDRFAPVEPLQDLIESDDIFAILANFTEEGLPALAQNDVNEVNNPNRVEIENAHNGVGNNETTPCSDGFDIFEDLGDLGNLGRYNKHQETISTRHNISYSMEETFATGNDQFLELMDLDVPLNCCSGAGEYDIIQPKLHNFADRSSSVELVSGSEEFRMGGSFVQNGGNQGSFHFQASVSPHTSAIFRQTSGTGSGQTSQPIRRAGGEERNNYLMGVRRWKCRHDIGSSNIHVKAEVNLVAKDALSQKLEESLCIVYGVYNLAKRELMSFRLLLICPIHCGLILHLLRLFLGSLIVLFLSIAAAAVLFCRLLNSVFWLQEVEWSFNSSVNDMHIKFVIILRF